MSINKAKLIGNIQYIVFMFFYIIIFIFIIFEIHVKIFIIVIIFYFGVMLGIQYFPKIAFNRKKKRIYLPKTSYKYIRKNADKTFIIPNTNNLIELFLVNRKTEIFINKKLFMQCKYVPINIFKEDINEYEEIKNIDQVIDNLDNSREGYLAAFISAFRDEHLYENEIVFENEITPETEFQVHCSNLQAWAENGFDTDILHTNIAFPLLKKLVDYKFKPAKRIFKEEIARRFNEGTDQSRNFLLIEGYLNYLNSDEKAILKKFNNNFEILDYVTGRSISSIPANYIDVVGYSWDTDYEITEKEFKKIKR